MALKKASNIVETGKFDAFHLLLEHSVKPSADENAFHIGYLFSLFCILNSYCICKRLFLPDP